MMFAITKKAQGKKSSRLISVRLPEELLGRLAEAGNAESLSMSDTLRLVLERGLAAGKQKKSDEKKKRKE